MASWYWLVLSHTAVAGACFQIGAWAMRSHRDEIAGVRSPSFREWWRSVTSEESTRG